MGEKIRIYCDLGIHDGIETNWRGASIEFRKSDLKDLLKKVNRHD